MMGFDSGLEASKGRGWQEGRENRTRIRRQEIPRLDIDQFLGYNIYSRERLLRAGNAFFQQGRKKTNRYVHQGQRTDGTLEQMVQLLGGT